MSMLVWAKVRGGQTRVPDAREKPPPSGCQTMHLPVIRIVLVLVHLP